MRLECGMVRVAINASVVSEPYWSIAFPVIIDLVNSSILLVLTGLYEAYSCFQKVSGARIHALVAGSENAERSMIQLAVTSWRCPVLSS